MRRWTAIFLVALATLQAISAQNTTDAPDESSTSSIFGELPSGVYNSTDGMDISKGSLNHLFDMARGFVNVVFKPFSELSGFITDMLSASDPFGYFSANWQTAASFEAGYMACLVFGLLFIILVPIVGSCMCCCRCCCGNCGGRLEQSEKRSKSCWRQCLCVSMLILTVFMAIPTIFVFLTNEWVTQVIDNGPTKTVALLGDVGEYLNLVPKQITYITNQYQTVDDNVRPLVSDFGVTIGKPLQEKVEELAAPSLAAMDETIKAIDVVNDATNNVDTSLSVLQTGMASLNSSLDTLRTNIKATVNSCTGTDIPICDAVDKSADNLVLGFDPAEFDSLRDDLKDVNDSINDFNVKELRDNVTKEIEDIPQKTKDETQSATDSALKALDDTQETMNDLSSNIPTDQFEDIENQISNLQTTITDAVDSYDENFDKYRYIAGIVLGSILAVIVAAYFIALLLGICGHDRKLSPVDRSGASNCGGIMLMVGVGLSFIFSWILMILVLVTFTVGGHGERYGCQPAEPPNFELLQFIDDETTVLNLQDLLGLPSDVSLGVTDIMKSCQKDESAYQAFKLEYLFNITAYLSNVTSFTDDVEQNVNDAVADINLDTIDVYSEEDQADLLALKETGLEGINFTDYVAKLGDGVTKINLTTYAAFLREAADNATDPTLQTELRDRADEVDTVQENEVENLQDDYDTLESSIKTLMAEEKSINGTIENLDTSLVALNDSVKTDGKAIIDDIAKDVTGQVLGNITSYTTWTGDQITKTLGACQPVFNVYAGVVEVFCDYLIDTLNGLWFSLGWCVFFLIPSAIVAMKLMKFFRRMEACDEFEDTWDDMEMREYGANGKAGGQYY